jgi:hypothetical protein
MEKLKSFVLCGQEGHARFKSIFTILRHLGDRVGQERSNVY